MTTAVHPQGRTGPRTRGPGRTRRLPIAVAVLSLLYGVLGVTWLLNGPIDYPFGPTGPDADRISLLAFIPTDVGAGLIAVLGFLGVPAALAHTQSTWTPSAYRPLLAFTALQAIVFGLLAPSMTVIVLAGYLLVLVGLPVAFAFLVAGAWRQPVTRALLLGVLALVATLQLTTGLFDWEAFRNLGTALAHVPERVGTTPLFVLTAFLLGAGWTALGIRTLRTAQSRCPHCGRSHSTAASPGVSPTDPRGHDSPARTARESATPSPHWTDPESARRWGFWATIIAALCPMPYALLRMTWLLPTPIGLGIDSADLDADPGMKLFGLGLGLIALASGIVTLGLIRPWGETWPRWIPFLAGRPVPIKAAVIPGATAAAFLLVSSLSLVQMLWLPEESLLTNLGHLALFPFPLWGTTLAIATAAYYYRRRPPCPYAVTQAAATR
ncbi:hypothetical protein [Kribbella sp. NPDC051770]|uniref:hypothetical protein n=1 Tax=Kribbella sp. NPDC051770 TaxID=3155413 RepID=UPI0034227789